MSPFLSEDKSRTSRTSSLAGFIFLSCALGDTRSVEIQCEAIVETLFITLYGALFVKTLGVNLFLALGLEIIVQLFLNWNDFVLLTLW